MWSIRIRRQTLLLESTEKESIVVIPKLSVFLCASSLVDGHWELLTGMTPASRVAYSVFLSDRPDGDESVIWLAQGLKLDPAEATWREAAERHIYQRSRHASLGLVMDAKDVLQERLLAGGFVFSDDGSAKLVSESWRIEVSEGLTRSEHNLKISYWAMPMFNDEVPTSLVESLVDDALLWRKVFEEVPSKPLDISNEGEVRVLSLNENAFVRKRGRLFLQSRSGDLVGTDSGYPSSEDVLRELTGLAAKATEPVATLIQGLIAQVRNALDATDRAIPSASRKKGA
ncbi:MAG: hypothetical protein ACI9BV_003900 [Rhodothermales bacterium]